MVVHKDWSNFIIIFEILLSITLTYPMINVRFHCWTQERHDEWNKTTFYFRAEVQSIRQSQGQVHGQVFRIREFRSGSNCYARTLRMSHWYMSNIWQRVSVSAAQAATLIAGKFPVWLMGNTVQVRRRGDGGTPELTCSCDRSDHLLRQIQYDIFFTAVNLSVINVFWVFI